MTKKNKFGIEPLAPVGGMRRERSVGPMGAAVREAADDLHASTEAKVEQRRKNAEDAKAFRDAQAEGRVLVRIPLGEISTSALPRDRIDLEAVALADEMEELKSSIRARGQKEPVEVFRDADGVLQLKKGWRRLTALRQLLDETGDEAFGTVVARIDDSAAERLERYIDMVEENVVREDLTFAEMAQVVLEAAADPSVEERDTDVLVNRLYGSLHKMKRSYIRSFVTLLGELGDALRWPKAVPRNLGVEVVRRMQREGDVGGLARVLRQAGSAEAQRAALERYASGAGEAATKPVARREKYECRVADMKITARDGECRIKADLDFTGVPRDRLEEAIRAFDRVLKGG
ncbi:ParB/RepB/Spo0J family partition protein [Silicimonas sp. MF1-12-2]|uniref:ParB/RepB/Spo0J family partition protein n=1 Tax=Silicimonas sp. MF1-12-2 TaxID=3384793 RepID=UPI0039B4B54B